MKKTNLTISLAFAAMLLTACSGNKEPVANNNSAQVEHGEVTFKVDFNKVYSGSDELKAKNNLIEKLSYGISEVNATGNMYSLMATNNSMDAKVSANLKFYENNVYTSDMHTTTTYKCYDADIMEETEESVVFAVTDSGEQLVAREHEYDDGYNGVHLLVNSYNCDDICQAVEMADLVYSGATYGVDTNGKNVCYYSSILDNSFSGYDKNGNVIDVYTYQILEEYIVYSGDVFTGKPLEMHMSQRIIEYFDDNFVVSEKPIERQCYSYDYFFKYGKRQTYKDRDNFIEGLKKPVFSTEPYVRAMGFPVTLNADQTAIDTIDTSIVSVSSDFETRFDKFTDNGSKAEGKFLADDDVINANYAYALGVVYNIKYMDFGASGEATVKSVTDYSIGNYTIDTKNMPDTLKVFEKDGVKYLVPVEDFRLKNVMGSVKVEIEKVDSDWVVSPDVTLKF